MTELYATHLVIEFQGSPRDFFDAKEMVMPQLHQKLQEKNLGKVISCSYSGLRGAVCLLAQVQDLNQAIRTIQQVFSKSQGVRLIVDRDYDNPVNLFDE